MILLIWRRNVGIYLQFQFYLQEATFAHCGSTKRRGNLDEFLCRTKGRIVWAEKQKEINKTTTSVTELNVTFDP